jgi:hypothetical protein
VKLAARTVDSVLIGAISGELNMEGRSSRGTRSGLNFAVQWVT